MRQNVLFVILAILKIVFSLPLKEKISAVDLKYHCVKVTAAEEKVQEKTPILLIHDVGRSHKDWDGTNVLLSLRTKRRVCSVDLRNHGDSPWNKRSDVKAFVADIGKFLDKQRIKKVNIIGQSLGGKIAVDYTLKNPKRIDSIVVEDMRPNGVVKDAYNQVLMFFKILKEALVKVPSKVSEERAKEIITSFLNKKLKQLGRTEKFTRQSLKYLQLKLVNGRWSYEHNNDVLLKAMKDQNVFLGKSSGVYKGPALFIYGTKSPFKVAEDKTNILKLFPKAKLIPIKGAVHEIHQNFRQFDDEVIKFLNGIK